jgi:hypothetical protein
MAKSFSSFYIVKGKLKILLFQAKQVGKMIITKIISIQKKIIFYGGLTLGSIPVVGATLFPLPMPYPRYDINQIPRESQTQMEKLISESSNRLPYLIQEPAAKPKVLVPEYSKLEMPARSIDLSLSLIHI